MKQAALLDAQRVPGVSTDRSRSGVRQATPQRWRGGLGREVSWILRSLTLPGAEYVMPLLFPRCVADRGDDIGPTSLASRNLPNRFLSLLGDSTSPSFDWEDLTVYTVGYTWSDGKDQEWHVDLSTRTQPSPSSQLLSRALSGDLASSAMVVGYSRRTGE